MSDYITADDTYTDYDSPTSEDVSEVESADDYAGGTEYRYSQGEQETETNERIQEIIAKAVDQERRRHANIDKVVSRVNPNYSGQSQFRTVRAPANTPVQICQEKENRGLVKLYYVSDDGTSATVLSIGTHIGILPEGTDTLSLPMEFGSVEIRTRQALWAVCDGGFVVFSMIEEFD